MAAAFLGMLLLVVLVPAYAQTTDAVRVITNIAEASWRSGDLPGATTSNEVTLEIDDTPVTIGTFVPSPTGGVQYPLSPSLCGGAPIDMSFMTGGSAGTGPVALDATNEIRIGQTLFFSIDARRANRDSSSIDSIEVVISAQSGDEERLTIFETGENTGEFVGAVPTTLVPPAPVQGDCVLSLRSGDDITISYPGPTGNPIVSTIVAAISNPFSYVFDSQDGNLVTGARVTIIDTATGQRDRLRRRWRDALALDGCQRQRHSPRRWQHLPAGAR